MDPWTSRTEQFVSVSLLPCLVIDIADGRIRAANLKARELLNMASLESRDIATLMPKQVPELIVFTDAVRHFGESWTRDLELHRQDDAGLKVEIHGRIIDIDGAPMLVMQIIDLAAYETRTRIRESRDLHAKGLMEWNRARDFFQEMERENRLILDAAGEGIYGIDLEGKTTFVNNAAQAMLGWTAQDLLGEDIHAMIHHHHLDGRAYLSRECPIYHSFRNEQVNRVEDEVFWHKDGHPIQVEYVSTPIYDQKVLAGAVVIFRDITERRESERKLRGAMEEIDALKTQLEQENEYLQEEIRNVRTHYDLVGSSPAIMRTLAQIDLVAETQSNVLITGESGTGKALVASAIHKASSRAKRAMIHVNCAGISGASFESELFGHVRGAFQGALHDRTGRLEIANGGTLFLDEVSEIPFDLQGKVLTALQDQSLERLGENRAHKLNVRVIASSTKDLAVCIKEGAFREDLYFFLNVFPIECRPLRERLSDIPELTQHFLKVTCERLNLPLPTITRANVSHLKGYHWPGNVRELQNVIERGAILARGEKLVLDLQKLGASRSAVDRSGVLTEDQLTELQIQNIVQCLKKTGGRVSGDSGAAQLLGIKPTTLYSRIKKFGISKDLLT